MHLALSPATVKLADAEDTLLHVVTMFEGWVCQAALGSRWLWCGFAEWGSLAKLSVDGGETAECWPVVQLAILTVVQVGN